MHILPFPESDLGQLAAHHGLYRDTHRCLHGAEGNSFGADLPLYYSSPLKSLIFTKKNQTKRRSTMKMEISIPKVSKIFHEIPPRPFYEPAGA